MADDSFYMGKVAVITGGGRGFGKAFGEALAARGAKVLLVDVDRPAAKAAAAAIRATGGEASGFAGDVASEEQMAAAMNEAVVMGGAWRAQIKAQTQFLAIDGKEQHIVDAMLFLTSPQAEFITGEVLKVGGGMGAAV